MTQPGMTQPAMTQAGIQSGTQGDVTQERRVQTQVQRVEGSVEAARFRHVVARYGADTLEAMTPAQLRDAVLYLLAIAGRDPLFAAAPSKYQMETSLIDLGAALTEAQRNFKLLERDFYLAAFGRYDG